ncbi:MAG: site-2 protease family protein [Akkermansiaceae bacterium]
MLEFTLFKIPIRVEPVFWITLGLIGFMSTRGLGGDAVLMGTALFVMAGFISILIHELGHALMVKKYKLPTQIVLSSFGGYATHPAGVLDRKQSFLVTLGGPALQAAFGLLLYIIAPYLNLPSYMIQLFIGFLIWVSLAWAILNCIPVLPLDGGRMLEAALGPRKIKLTLTISMAVAAASCVLGFTMKQPFLGIFMAMFAFQNYQALERFK